VYNIKLILTSVLRNSSVSNLSTEVREPRTLTTRCTFPVVLLLPLTKGWKFRKPSFWHPVACHSGIELRQKGNIHFCLPSMDNVHLCLSSLLPENKYRFTTNFLQHSRTLSCYPMNLQREYSAKRRNIDLLQVACIFL